MAEEKIEVKPRTQRKKTQKKAPAKQVAEKVEKQEVEEVEVKEVEKKPSPAKKLEGKDMVRIMNNTSGKLLWKSPRTGLKLRLSDYGQEDEIEYSELVTMNSNSSMLQNGYLLILDEQAIKQLHLTKLYENLLDYDSLEEFYELSGEDMTKLLQKMPKNMRETVGAIAKRKYRNGDLFDVRKITALEKELGTEIMD